MKYDISLLTAAMVLGTHVTQNKQPQCSREDSAVNIKQDFIPKLGVS